MWPTGDLGRAVKQMKPVTPPTAMMSRIGEFVQVRDNVKAIIDDVCERFQAVDWAEGSVDTLVYRGKNLSKLVGEVWDLP